jgi:hypothetical protein
MSQQFQTALVRGVIGAVIFAGSAFFGQLATGSGYKAAGVAAGVAFFGYLILRSGIEGYIDTQAAQQPPKAA